MSAADDLNQAKAIAVSGSDAQRAVLAARRDLPPELLYFLANDKAANVRQAVAGNESAPPHVAPLLHADPDVNVRQALAGRLARLLPTLSGEAQASLQALVLESLTVLAKDQTVSVRQALASSLSDIARLPPKLANTLARDAEQRIAEPVLRFCLTLSDQDLLDIIATHPPAWALVAMATRETVSAPVSGAIIEADEAEALVALAGNQGAQIAPPDMEILAETAEKRPALREVLAVRPGVPVHLAQRLLSLIDGALAAAVKAARLDDEVTAQEVQSAARDRLAWKTEPAENPQAKVRRLRGEGRLDEAAITAACSWAEREFVAEAIAALAGVPPAVVTKIFEAKSAKGVTAIAWRAGLSMRLALQLQRDIARLDPRSLINARNGFEYPLTPDEMNWHLEFFGIKQAGGKTR
jgi:uncharacterized protein (DUF2336 family)